ncbi:hypothetical protein [Anditalea andensis]|uniref:HNH domain-containing protein n=1 Tax=Anditalea andensis TaxID=1048983 RepID=A0A074KTK4_9BACT|nr:hypothetical protein [Anditalea andensis]KEO72224.1 hypothetical protein EL17_18665 [Anditalea andensis]
MLYLNPNTPKFIKAKRAFNQGMLDFVFKRIDTIKKLEGVNTNQIECFFDLYINEHLDEILIGRPTVLNQINQRLNGTVKLSKSLLKGVEHVFNYDSFIYKKKKMYDGYKLAEDLDVRTCTYCNRNYTNTVISSNGQKITRPQFDHYFDKRQNPLLAISFYNLIPSCSICNSSIKGTHKMTLNDYTHPYLDNALGDITFTYKYSHKSKNGLKVKVITPDPSKAKNTVDAFAIEEVYNSHTGELLDVLRTKQYFSERYLTILKSNLLKDVIVSKEDLYRIVFGTEYDETSFINRPFSKFKNDILKELGII